MGMANSCVCYIALQEFEELSARLLIYIIILVRCNPKSDFRRSRSFNTERNKLVIDPAAAPYGNEEALGKAVNRAVTEFARVYPVVSIRVITSAI